jgi:hypothetical protein
MIIFQSIELCKYKNVPQESETLRKPHQPTLDNKPFRWELNLIKFTNHSYHNSKNCPILKG